MMKLIFVVVTLVTLALSAPPSPPTAAEAEAELVAAGISTTVAQGIVAIAQKYTDQFTAAKSDREAGRAAFEEFHTEVEAYMKTQSQDDQTAYDAYIEKKQSQQRAFYTTPSSK